MNEERIKAFALQAKFMAEEDINRQISYNAELKAFAEKFAELIVRECIKLNGKELAMPGHSRMVDVYCEHFGIEL